MFRWFSLTLTGNLAYALAQWGVVIILARLGSLEAQGAYNYALAIVAPLTMFSRLNLRAVLATDQSGRFRFSDYRTVRAMSAAIPLAIAIPYVYFTDGITPMIFLVAAVAFMKAAEGIADILYGELQNQQAFPTIVASLIARSLLMLMCFYGTMYAGFSLPTAILATGVGWFLIYAIYERQQVAEESTSSDEGAVKRRLELVRQCWSLGVTMSLVTVFGYVPIYVLESSASLVEVGQYAAVSYFWMAGTFVATAVIQASSPTLSRKYRDSFKEYRSAFARINVILALGGVFAVILIRAVADEIVLFLYGEDYRDLGPLLSMMAVCIVINASLSMLGLNLTIARAFRSMLALNIVAVLAVMSFSAFLIPSQGIRGAALSLLGGLLVKLVASIAFNHRLLKPRSETPARFG